MSVLPAAVNLGLGYCQVCREHGCNVPATRQTPRGTKLCEMHWRSMAGMPAARPTERKVVEMPAKAEVDWAAAQRDRDAGMSVSDVAGKYRTSAATVYGHTENGKKRAGGASAGKAEAPAGPGRTATAAA